MSRNTQPGAAAALPPCCFLREELCQLIDPAFCTEKDCEFLRQPLVMQEFLNYLAQHPFDKKSFDVNGLFHHWRTTLPEQFSNYVLPISPGIFKASLRAMARRQALIEAVLQVSPTEIERVKKTSTAHVVLCTTVLADGVGDFVCVLKILGQLKESFPKTKSTLIVVVEGGDAGKCIARTEGLQKIAGAQVNSDDLHYFLLHPEVQNFTDRINKKAGLNEIIQSANLLINVSFLHQYFNDLIKIYTQKAEKKPVLHLGEISSDPFVSVGDASTPFASLSSQFDPLGCTNFGMVGGFLFDPYILENIHASQAELRQKVQDPKLNDKLANRLHFGVQIGSVNLSS